MAVISRRVWLAGLILAATAGAAWAQARPAQPYLFDLMKRPAFRASFDRLFVGQAGVDAWIGVFARTGNGVTGPAEPRMAGTQRLLLTQVCKPHDCGDNQLYVLFSADGARATALLAQPGQRRWFGNPGPEERDILTRAARN